MSWIKSPLLSQIKNLEHGFGTKKSETLVSNLVYSKQVHGTQALMVRESCQSEYDGYDVLMTDQKGIAVAVKTADCLPILLVEPVHHLVAAVHAGWKGTLARVVEKTIEKIERDGGDVKRLVAAMGPCMGRDCYEVERDVKAAFEKEFSWPILKQKSEKKWLLDLQEANRRQMMNVGMRLEQIDSLEFCTYCRGDLFYSYRREKENAGRMFNFIKWI